MKLLGKTRCINYFLVNKLEPNSFYIVDLPGYGYSKMSNTESQNIFKLTNYFLETNKNIVHIFLILDIRHKPTQDDKTMYKWLISNGIPFTIILNKADKLSKLRQDESVKNITKDLLVSEEIITFSSETKQNVSAILDIIYDNI